MKGTLIFTLTLLLGVAGFLTTGFAQTYDHQDTLNEGTGLARALAFSPNGELLASGGGSNVYLHDPGTGMLERTLRGHTAVVTVVAFSPDGSMLASASGDRTIKLWNPQTGRLIRTLRGHTNQIYAMAFSRTGQLASGGRDNTVRLWDTQTGTNRILGRHDGWVLGIAFSYNGLLASSGRDNTIRIWNATTGAPMGALIGHTNFVTSVAFTATGDTLVSGSSDNTLRIWNAATGGAALQTLRGHTDAVNSVAVFVNGTIASASADETARLWNLQTGQRIATFNEHTDLVRVVAFSRDGQYLASGSSDGTVRLWRRSGLDEPQVVAPPVVQLPGEDATFAQTYDHQDTLNEGTGLARALAFSPNGSLLASGGGNNIYLHAPGTGMLEHTLRGHTAIVTVVAFSPDGRMLASASGDHTIKLWNPQTGQLIRTLRGHSNQIYAMAFSRTGQLASGGRDNTVRLWDTQTGTNRILGRHDGWVLGIAFSYNGLLASSGRDNTIRIWNATTGAPMGALIGHTNFVTSVAFTATGDTLVSGSSDNTLRIWNAATGGAALQILRGHTDAVNSVAVSVNGTIASASADETVRLWNLQTGQSLATLHEHMDKVRIVAFSPNGQWLASGSSDGTVQVYQRSGPDETEVVVPPVVQSSGEDATLATDFTWHALLRNEGQNHGLAFSPDGLTLASLGANQVYLWDPDTEQLKETLQLDKEAQWIVYDPDGTLLIGDDASPFQLRDFGLGNGIGHTSIVRTVAFSPDWLTFASGSSDKTIRLWTVKGNQISTLQEEGQVWAVAFSPDGQTLASGGGFRGIHLWDLSTNQIRNTLVADTAQVEGLAFSPDGLTLAVATGLGSGEAVHLWDLSTNQIKDILTVPDTTIRKLAFRPDGKMLVGGAYTTSGPGVAVWKQGAFSPTTELDSVELSGPSIAGPGGSYDFTVTVKDSSGQILSEDPLKVQLSTGDYSKIVWTNDKGEAAFSSVTFPTVGKEYDIAVTVHEPVSKQELRQNFPRRVKVPIPHSITVSSASTKTATRFLGGRARPPVFHAIIKDSSGNKLADFSWTAEIRESGTKTWHSWPSKGVFPGTYDTMAKVGGAPDVKAYVPRHFTILPAPSSCGTFMPDDMAPLSQTRSVLKKTEVVSEGSIEVSTPKWIVSREGGETRTWTTADTVAEDTDSLIITCKFLNAKKEDRDRIPEIANEWSKYGNVLFRFVTSGPADVPINMLYGKEGTWNADVGSIHQNSSNDPRMNLSPDYSTRTILHEFGHVLGLIHDHLSPQFEEIFEWQDKDVNGDGQTDDAFYDKINKNFTGDLTSDHIEHNFLRVQKEVDERSEFDRHSIMIYGISANLIEARPGAPSWAKELADDDKGSGIYENLTLSVGDQEFIATIYGPAKPRVRVTGTIAIEGLDKEPFWKSDERITESQEVNILHGSQSEYVTYAKPTAVFKWGSECRVEVYLSFRKVVEKNHVEVAVSAFLFEGTTENTTDLEDWVCYSFKIPLNYSNHWVKFSLKNQGGWTAENIDARVRACRGLDIKIKTSTLSLKGDFFGGGDWANVTVSLSTKSVPLIGLADILAAGAPAAAAVKHRPSQEISDVNGDGRVTVADLVLVSNHIGQTDLSDSRVDLNADGIVTIVDLVHVAQHLGSSTDPAAPAHIVAPKGLAYETVEGWLAGARAADDGSRLFLQGITNLERLLLLIIPEETVLLHNYPNPFNPETWIPYHLAEAAEVTLTIYAVDGTVVRTLALGHQPAGFYESRSRAAYWDGRNAIGERVASGVYFYTLTAGDFATTGKMLILK